MRAHADEISGISVFQVKPLRNIVRPERPEQLVESQDMKRRRSSRTRAAAEKVNYNDDLIYDDADNGAAYANDIAAQVPSATAYKRPPLPPPAAATTQLAASSGPGAETEPPRASIPAEAAAAPVAEEPSVKAAQASGELQNAARPVLSLEQPTTALVSTSAPAENPQQKEAVPSATPVAKTVQPPPPTQEAGDAAAVPAPAAEGAGA